MSRPRLIALLLALTTLLVYLPAAHFGFVNYDDPYYVTENSVVQNGLTWAGIRWALTTVYANNWHPLTWLSHMADCDLFGLNPAGHHFVNVLFHAVNAALLFALLFRLTGVLWTAAFAAALFAWHPLHVESVAWVAERKDVLSTFFALLSLLSYACYTKEDRCRSFWFALIFFALGLMAKPMLVTLPFVLLLLDYWPLQRIPHFKMPTIRRLVLEKWPFFLLAAISCAATCVAQAHLINDNSAIASLQFVPLEYRLKNIPVAYVEYLLKLAWPANLAVFYPLADTISITRAAIAVITLVLVSLAVWQVHLRYPYLLAGWLWFLGTLVPVIGLVQVGGQSMADRYSYIPSIGIFIMVAYAAHDLLKQFPDAKVLFATAAGMILAGCLFATEKQLSFWQNSETLFRHDLAVAPNNNDIAHCSLAIGLEAQGKLPEALAEYQAAAQISPSRYIFHNNLGDILDKLGRHAESLAEYREAIRLRPGDAFLHDAAGSELTALGQFDAALKEFNEAERLDPNYAQPHAGTAKVFLLQGRDTEAVDELRTAVRLEPDNFRILAIAAYYLSANENAAARDGQYALALAAKANTLAGGRQPMVFDVFGMACAETGDFTNAAACAENALILARAAKLNKIEPIQQRLALYKNHQPWRESFLATNAPVNIKP